MSKRYLLDTGEASLLLFHRRGVAERADAERAKGARVGCCFPVFGELAGGFNRSASRERCWAIARPHLKKLVWWPFDHAAALEYGEIVADLRRRGRPMQQIDMQIAAVARVLDACVVTGDSDFSAIPGLDLEKWSAD